jgi:hypothetical protein
MPEILHAKQQQLILIKNVQKQPKLGALDDLAQWVSRLAGIVTYAGTQGRDTTTLLGILAFEIGYINAQSPSTLI